MKKENNDDGEVEVISGKEMLQRKIQDLEREKAFKVILADYTMAKLSEIEERVNNCKYLTEARQIEDELRFHRRKLRKIEPLHNSIRVETKDYKTDEDFAEDYNVLLGDRIRWFDGALDDLFVKIKQGELKQSPDIKGLEIAGLNKEFIKKLYRYLITERSSKYRYKYIIKDEGTSTYENFVYALIGEKPSRDWKYTPITLLASKKELRLILSHIINGNPLGSLSNELRRRAGDLFFNKDGEKIGLLNNLNEDEKSQCIDDHKDFFENNPIKQFST